MTATSFEATMSTLSGRPDESAVSVSLVIHSQAKSAAEQAPYVHYAYVGFGVLHYIKAAATRDRLRIPRSAHLTTDGSSIASVRVLNDYAHAGSPPGSSVFQSFLVDAPAAEFWHVRIDPPISARPARGGGPRYSARILIDRPDAPARAPWAVDLIEDQAFLRGIGQDPLFPDVEALYSIAFGEISDYNPIT